MKPNFLRLWNRLESVLVADADSPEQRRRRATLIAISSFSVFAGIISGTNTLLTSGSPTHGLIPCTFSLVVGLAVLVFFATRQFFHSPVLVDFSADRGAPVPGRQEGSVVVCRFFSPSGHRPQSR